MIWKKFQSNILEFILLALVSYAIFMSRYGSQGFINRGVEIFTLASGLEGWGELKRRGYRRVKRNFLLFIIILFTSNLILLLTQTVRDIYLQIGFYSCFAVFAAMFPVAYYLSRNHTKSTQKPASANAS
jgi:hypothetical protein